MSVQSGDTIHLENYCSELNCSDFDREMNQVYYQQLHNKFHNNEAVEMVLREEGNESKVVPYAIASEAEKKLLPLKKYEDLPDANPDTLRKTHLCICKMQAGLGSSLKRDDLLARFTTRKQLGSKGTDLFINYEGNILSIAEVQLLQVLPKRKQYHRISYFNLINEETAVAVKDIWKKSAPESELSYEQLLKEENVEVHAEVYQAMMPTVNSQGDLTTGRIAPAGHGFLGFYEILKLFKNQDADDGIVVIGNGEDLRSTPDDKIISWVAENEVPIVMITTTKLEKDKKGGQLAIVAESQPYVAIVEKAQAERANQVSYFEEIGLREEDDISLFNTNIVVLNRSALKKKLEQISELDLKSFAKILAPDLIKNTKTQDGKDYIQLEGAIGSVLLNLDKYFRQNINDHVVEFLNLAPQDREKFFLPLKKRQDFDELYGDNIL